VCHVWCSRATRQRAPDRRQFHRRRTKGTELRRRKLGHARGLSNANSSFLAESIDGDIDVTGSQPFAGSVLPLATNNFGVTSHLAINGAVMNGLFPNGRQLLSDADILANAQLSGWHTTLSPEPVPEPATLWLMGSGVIALAAGARGRRKRANPRS
jgi:hypothetical protein